MKARGADLPGVRVRVTGYVCVHMRMRACVNACACVPPPGDSCPTGAGAPASHWPRRPPPPTTSPYPSYQRWLGAAEARAGLRAPAFPARAPASSLLPLLRAAAAAARSRAQVAGARAPSGGAQPGCGGPRHPRPRPLGGARGGSARRDGRGRCSPAAAEASVSLARSLLCLARSLVRSLAQRRQQRSRTDAG